MAIRKTLKRGFTLIELMIVVAIIGILAVLAIYGVSRYLKTSKTAEATNNIGQIGKNATEAYTREKMSATYVAPGQSSSVTTCLCKAATNKVPATGVPHSAKAVANPSEWLVGDATTGWMCLKYSIDGPQYYQYSYASSSTCAGGSQEGTTFDAIANGDLDGNNTTSQFQLHGEVHSGNVILAPKVVETNPEE